MANGYWQLVTATVAWFTGHAANDKCNCHFMRSHSCVEVGRGLEGVQLGCKLYPDVTTSWATHTHTLTVTLGRRFYCVIHISFAPDRGAKGAEGAQVLGCGQILSAAVSG